MAKPTILANGQAAAWGDLAELSENMLGNLFAVSIKLPKVLQRLGTFKGTNSTISMLCSAADIPEEVLTVIPVPTKLSDYDIVVGKQRGTLTLTFLEQVGAPVSNFFTAWHKGICDARGTGLSYPSEYRAEVWVAALTGDGTPYYWWGHKGACPVSKGKPTFGNDNKTPVAITIPFSYIELADLAETLTGEGSNIAKGLAAAAASIGV